MTNDQQPEESAPKPRSNTWGEPSDRAALRAIAEDVRIRSGFGVCAIEVLRADAMLEFVAIAGSDDGEARLLGQASPLEVMQPALHRGATFGAFTFVAHEWLTDETKEALEEFGGVPDNPERTSSDAWHPEDMLAARIVDDRGQLRGLLHLDEPVDGNRRSDQELQALNESLALPLRATLTAFEREALAHQARLLSAAAEAVRGLSGRDGVATFICEAATHLSGGLRAHDLAIRLLDGSHGVSALGLPEPVLQALDRSAARPWVDRSVVIVETNGVWGDDNLAREVGDDLSAYVRTSDSLELVSVPIGTPDEALGMLLVLRSSPRWTDAESTAGLEMGHDLARAIQLAQAFEREQDLVAELRRVDTERTAFARTIAHELGNPLTLVASHSEVLLDMDLTSVQRHSVEAIDSNARRIEALLDDLSALTRPRGPEVQFVPVDMSALARVVVDNHRRLAARHGIDLAVTTEPDLRVEGNQAALSDALTNLLSNAIKYIDEGGSIRVSARRLRHQVVIECADTGIGISTEDQAHLFTAFFRSTNETALARPGTGLGLSIVQQTVTEHGGQVEVESTLGIGTTFTVRLPAAD